MLFDDIIYISALLLCIAFGPFYRKIENHHTKQWIGTIVGLLLIVIVSGSFMLHPIIVILVNAIIITKLSWKVCHLVSFYFSFFYLLVIFRLGYLVGLPLPPGHTNIIVMILTLKLSGLAFEINSAATTPPNDTQGTNSPALKHISFLDVIHYAFSYMGVFIGPYYRYRTYWDHLHRPFAKYADPWPLTFYKLKLTAVLSVLFLIMDNIYKAEYILTEEYAEHSLLYRFLYIYPVFATFELRMFIGAGLAESACQTAGLGVYPKDCNNVPGRGPKDYEIVENLSSNLEALKKVEYDYETVNNMNVRSMATCSLVRTAMKVWNSCIQYWMAICVYKRFPYKTWRTVATLLLSALWHGYCAGYYFTICQVSLYLPFEDTCIKYRSHVKSEVVMKIWDVFLWFMRVSCMAYLGIPFLLLNYNEIIYYYKSLYFCGHIFMVILYILAWAVKPFFKKQKKEEKDR